MPFPQIPIAEGAKAQLTAVASHLREDHLVRLRRAGSTRCGDHADAAHLFAAPLALPGMQSGSGFEPDGAGSSEATRRPEPPIRV